MFIWSFLTTLLDLVSKMFSSVSICYNNYEREGSKRKLKNVFFKRFLFKDVYLGL